MSSRGRRRGGKKSGHDCDNGFEEWGGYMGAKVQKLQEQFKDCTSEGQESNIFKGVAIFVNGYTNPTSDELKKIMLRHGGVYHHYYRRFAVTHIIASNLCNSKIKPESDVKVIKPEWITDSVKAGKLQPCLNYKLFTPLSRNQATLGFSASTAKDIDTTNALIQETVNNDTNSAPVNDDMIKTNDTKAIASTSGVQDTTIKDSNSALAKNIISTESHDTIASSSGIQDTTMKDTESALVKEVNSTETYETIASTSAMECEPDLLDVDPKEFDDDMDDVLINCVQEGNNSRDENSVSSNSNLITHSESIENDESSRETSPEIARIKSKSTNLSNISSKHSNGTLKPSIETSDSPSNFPVGFSNINQASNQTQSPYSTDKTLNASKISPRKAGDARDSTFVSEFYSNSRLHHISTAGAEFKAYVNKLRSEENRSFPGRDKLQRLAEEEGMKKEEGWKMDSVGGKRKRVIMHVDMDCFFVSVGLRNRSQLKGKPVAVTHSKGKSATKERPGTDIDYEKAHWKRKGLKLKKGPAKGTLDPTRNLDPEINPDLYEMMDVDGEEENEALPETMKQSTETFNSMAEIASCSYEARKTGVKNGMFMGKAKQLCPELITIPYDFEGYTEVSKTLYDTVASYTLEIEAVSCDEMLVDCTEILCNTGASPELFARMLREEIYAKTQCCASTGMGPNILLARMATRSAKPNGQFYLPEEESMDFIQDKPIRNLPGVGYAQANKLQLMGVEVCRDLQKIPIQQLQKEFGPKTGQSLYNYCRGIDERQMKMEQERKSVSAEINYGIRFTEGSEVEKFLSELSEEVHQRLTNLMVKGKTVTLKLKVRAKGAPKETAKFLGHGICDNITKSATLPLATDDAKVITKECMMILKAQRIPPADFRGIGIQVSRLEKPAQNQKANKQVKGLQSILSFTTTSKDPPPPSNDKAANSVKKPLQKDVSPNTHINRKKTSTTSNTSTTTSTSPTPLTASTTVSKTFAKHKSNLTNRIIEHQEDFEFDEMSFIENSMVVEPQSIPQTQTIKAHTSNASKNSSGKIASASVHVKTAPPPPLPDLPTLSSPNTSFLFRSFGKDGDLAGGNISGNVVATPKCRSVEQEEDLYMPSPSQIDPAILAELPHDIREEIQRTMAAQRKTRQPKTHTNLIQGADLMGEGTPEGRPLVNAGEDREDSQEAGCSHWQTAGKKQKEKGEPQRENRKQTGPIVSLPSFSQIDRSCLEALPPDLRAEIEAAYKQNESALPVSQANNSPTFKLQQAVGRSPGKSPHKSPTFKVPRGRPPKYRKRLSPKKLDYAGTKKTHASKQRAQQRDAEVIIAVTPTESSSSTEMPGIETEDTEDTAQMTEARTIDRVNLCGAVEWTEVKKLINQWINSCHAPQDEDISQFITYLADLAYDRNLEQLDLAIKFLVRRVREHEGWEHGCRLIVQQTQQIVASVYGAKLKLPESIATLIKTKAR